MMKIWPRIFHSFILLLILTACGDAVEVPTRAPTAEVPDSVSLPSTPQPKPTFTLGPPTATLTPSPTPVVPTITPVAFFGPGVNITTPDNGTVLRHGEEVFAGGLAQVGEGQIITLTLLSATGHELATADVELNEFNSWQATFTVPIAVTGAAEIRASVLDQFGETVATDTLEVELVSGDELPDRYLIIYRPENGTDTVAGYNLFFDGLAERPVDNIVTISVWNDECRSEVARQRFVLRGSGYWQGFIVVPRDVTGPFCAVAYFGEKGDQSWREAQVRMTSLPSNDEKNLRVLIGNPPPEKNLDPGRTLTLYGTAQNAPENSVLVSILLENGRVLNEGVTGVDTFGYWEVELFIPGDANGLAQINASIGDQSTEMFARHQVPVTIGTVE